MYQRRCTVPAGNFQEGGGCDDCAGVVVGGQSIRVATATSNNNTKKLQQRKPRRRRVVSKTKIAGIIDEDLLVLLIQMVSFLILTGCSFVLVSKNVLEPLWLRFSVSSATKFLVGGSGSSGGGGGNHHGLDKKYDKVPLKASGAYTIPGSMAHIGDKSDHYAQLRKEYDHMELPRIEPKHSFDSVPIADYDIHDCPNTPPEGYPFAWNLVDQVLHHWPPDDPSIPSDNTLHQGLCVFDYQKDYDKAMNYRTAEVPFVVKNDPAVQETVQRWNAPNYMERMLTDVNHRAEYSESNHFMYWNAPRRRGKKKQLKNGNNGWRQHKVKVPTDWQSPTEMIRMTYKEWLDHANVTDESLLGPDQPHWYFRLIGCGETGPEGQCDQGSSEYLFDELTFFQPKEDLYMVEPENQKGIHCRFGMKGVIAENHFDGSRNAIVVLGGERRYVLAHPNQCPLLSLLPKGHPSARHSAVDWSDPDLEEFPDFAKAMGNEVVLQAGDVLYLPTHWFHYIISLSLNFQCNTRSGISQEYRSPIKQCGF